MDFPKHIFTTKPLNIGKYAGTKSSSPWCWNNFIKCIRDRAISGHGCLREGRSTEDAAPTAAGPVAADLAAAGARIWSPDKSRCGSCGSPEMEPGSSRDGDWRGRRLDVRGGARTAVGCGSRGRRLDVDREDGRSISGWSSRGGGAECKDGCMSGWSSAAAECELRDDGLTTGGARGRRQDCGSSTRAAAAGTG